MLLLLTLPLWHAHQPVETESSKDVEDDESKANTVVSPAIVIVGADLSKERICARDWTILALAGREFVLHISASGVCKSVEKVATGLVAWGNNSYEFVVRASRVGVREASRQNSRDPVREGRQSVH